MRHLFTINKIFKLMLKKISFSLLLQTFIGLLAIGQTVNYKLISLEEPTKVKEDFSDFDNDM